MSQQIERIDLALPVDIPTTVISVIPQKRVSLTDTTLETAILIGTEDKLFLTRSETFELAQVLLQFQYLPKTVELAGKTIAHDLAVSYHSSDDQVYVEVQTSPFTTAARFTLNMEAAKFLQETLTRITIDHMSPHFIIKTKDSK